MQKVLPNIGSPGVLDEQLVQVLERSYKMQVVCDLLILKVHAVYVYVCFLDELVRVGELDLREQRCVCRDITLISPVVRFPSFDYS